MFKTFVVALDLSEDGDRALPIVEALASVAPLAIELVTVSEPGMPTDADGWELGRRAARFAGGEVTWNVIVDSDVAGGLLQYVARRPDSALVMATSARRPLTAALFGGVVHDVLRDTDRPVLLIGPHVDATIALGTTLVACVDASDAATWAVPAIVSWQQAVSSVPPRVVEVAPAGEPDVTASKHVDRFTSLLAAEGVEAVAAVVQHDDPVAGLERLADQLTGAIYVATSGRYTDGRPHLHSTTQELVRRASRPVLIVPARPMTPLAATLDSGQGCMHRPFENTIISPSVQAGDSEIRGRPMAAARRGTG